MKDWAVILGSSSGFGAATCREIASKGINIYGIHLDRRGAMESINSLVNELKSHNVEVHFKNMSATDAEKRKAIIEELKSIGNVRVKILMHSLAFGAHHPATTYEMLVLLVAFFVCVPLFLRFLKQWPGVTFSIVAMVYALTRYFLTEIRLDSPEVISSFLAPQIISVVIILIFFPMMVFWIRDTKKLRISKKN